MAKPKLDALIDDVLSEMAQLSPSSDEYLKLLDVLKELDKLRPKPWHPTADTTLQAAAHILGMVMIVRHEQFNIVTTKALGFVPRVR